MNTNLLTNAERAANILKAFTPDFAKGGEGSKGGHVIGHTKSGKTIYGDKHASHAHYKDFTDQEHHEASQAHYKEVMEHWKNKNREGQDKHNNLSGEHYEKTEEGKKQKAEHEADEKKHDFTNSLEGKVLKKNKKAIYTGLMALGEKYFGKQRSGFLHNDYADVSFNVIDSKTQEENDEPIVSDAYYLGGVFNSNTGKVEALPGYEEHEGDQITGKFVKDFYKNNKGKYLVSYDHENSAVSIIK